MDFDNISIAEFSLSSKPLPVPQFLVTYQPIYIPVLIYCMCNKLILYIVYRPGGFISGTLVVMLRLSFYRADGL